MTDTNIRINKYLASIGVASRRKIDQLILQGKIQVNGKTLSVLGLKVKPLKDKIFVEGEPVKQKVEPVYLVFNKPRGLIASTTDEHGRDTVVSFINYPKRIFPIGRLDRFASGLVILTNDGELALKLTHPRYKVPKTYHVRIYSQVSEKHVDLMKRHSLAKITILKKDPNSTLLEIIISENKNKEIRRMFSRLGLEVMNLDRVAIGSLGLGNLKIGEHRILTKEEIELLRN